MERRLPPVSHRAVPASRRRWRAPRESARSITIRVAARYSASRYPVDRRSPPDDARSCRHRRAAQDRSRPPAGPRASLRSARRSPESGRRRRAPHRPTQPAVEEQSDRRRQQCLREVPGDRGCRVVTRPIAPGVNCVQLKQLREAFEDRHSLGSRSLNADRSLKRTLSRRQRDNGMKRSDRTSPRLQRRQTERTREMRQQRLFGPGCRPSTSARGATMGSGTARKIRSNPPTSGSGPPTAGNPSARAAAGRRVQSNTGISLLDANA